MSDKEKNEEGQSQNRFQHDEIERYRQELIKEREKADLISQELIQERRKADLISQELIQEREKADLISQELIQEREKAFINEGILANQILKADEIAQENENLLTVKFITEGYLKNNVEFEELYNMYNIDKFSQYSENIITNYRTDQNDLNSQNMAGDDRNSTLSFNSSQKVNIGKFRRNLVKGTNNDISVVSWKLSLNKLTSFVSKNLFPNNGDAFKEFLAAKVKKLNMYRAYLFARSKLRDVNKDELTAFQPLYSLFLSDISKSLNGFREPIGTNDTCNSILTLANSPPKPTVVKNINVNSLEIPNMQCNIQGTIKTKTLSGCSDLGVMYLSSTVIFSILMLLCIIELKCPFGLLHLKNPMAAKDQLLGQLMAMNYMKNNRKPNQKCLTTYSLGFLTDMFILNIIIKPQSGKSYYITDHVKNADEYVICILLAFCKLSDEDISSLLSNDDDQEMKSNNNSLFNEKEIDNIYINNYKDNNKSSSDVNKGNQKRSFYEMDNCDYLSDLEVSELEEYDYDEISSYDEDDELNNNFAFVERLYYKNNHGYVLDEKYLQNHNEKYKEIENSK